MGKNFKQVITDLENGLVQLERILEDPKTNRTKYDAVKNLKEIQITSIDTSIEFFKKGYNFCKKEFKSQTELTNSDDLKVMNDDELIGSLPQ